MNDHNSESRHGNLGSVSERAEVRHGKERELESPSEVGSNPTRSDLRDLECKTNPKSIRKNNKK